MCNIVAIAPQMAVMHSRRVLDTHRMGILRSVSLATKIRAAAIKMQTTTKRKFSRNANHNFSIKTPPVHKKYAESLHSGRNLYIACAQSASFIQTLLSVSESHRFCDQSLADFTAGRGFHPALKPLLKREYHISPHLSSAVQSVTKAANRQMHFRQMTIGGVFGRGRRLRRPACIINFEQKLAAQGILTYFTNQTLPYDLYADESGLLVLSALVTSGCLSKTSFDRQPVLVKYGLMW